MPFHRKLPTKALGCGTSLRLHGHINSANVVIRNWEDYTGERAKIAPKINKNQPCNKQKIGNREMKRLMKPLQGLSFFLNSWIFEAQFLVISHTLSTALGYMSDVSSRGSSSWSVLLRTLLPPVRYRSSACMTALQKKVSRPSNYAGNLNGYCCRQDRA